MDNKQQPNINPDMTLNDNAYYVKTLQGRFMDLLNENLYLQSKISELIDEKKELEDKLKASNQE